MNTVKTPNGTVLTFNEKGYPIDSSRGERMRFVFGPSCSALIKANLGKPLEEFFDALDSRYSPATVRKWLKILESAGEIEFREGKWVKKG